jgi:hypothetical protein
MRTSPLLVADWRLLFISYRWLVHESEGDRSDEHIPHRVLTEGCYSLAPTDGWFMRTEVGWADELVPRWMLTGDRPFASVDG